MRRSEAADRGLGLTLREAFNRALTELAVTRPEIVMLDADNATATTEGIFAEAHPSRFLQMGAAEQNMVGVAAGLAAMGFVPFLSSYACFQVFRAHDQVRVLVAQTGLPVRFVGQSAGILTGLTGKTHQSIDDVATMRAMPGMTVVAPGDEVETREVVRWSLDHPGPVYIRLARGTSPLLFDQTYRFESPGAILVHEGEDLAIMSSGLQTSRVLAALPALEAAGIHPLVLHLPTIKPLDEVAIADVARIARRVVTVEDHTILGGLGGAVCEVLAFRCPVPVLRLGIQDTYAESASHDELVERYGISPRAVAASIVAWLAGGEEGSDVPDSGADRQGHPAGDG
jgi:transketolase